MRAYLRNLLFSPASTNTNPRIPLSRSARATSGRMSWPFHGATRPGTRRMRASSGTRQALRSASTRSRATAAGLKGDGVDAAWDDGEPLAWKIVARHDRRGRVVRWCDHPIPACERSRPIGAQTRGRRHVWQRGDEPDRDLRSRQVGAPGTADALRMHDVDPFGRNQMLEDACVPAKLQRVDEWRSARGPIHRRMP